MSNLGECLVSAIESKKRILYGHETRLMRYNKEAQVMNSASINYTQGYLYPNTYKTGDSGGSRDAYGCGGSRGAFSDRGVSRGGGGSGRGCRGG